MALLDQIDETAVVSEGECVIRFGVVYEGHFPVQTNGDIEALVASVTPAAVEKDSRWSVEDSSCLVLSAPASWWHGEDEAMAEVKSRQQASAQYRYGAGHQGVAER